ncbi:hypothetical protein [Cryptosporangium aurantiacum]|uniref:Uncharacterized protein n=1 Tax=Cryptosporangium aurantiacum TaxID=134849 RepID=A0A1M7PDE2_9ACTN|nr:hypothetical protein [Cryptosporangium aurantiacum]SHN14957.1 hypothetical protein SAMN05443668_103236 [Cryptosporangium aurantiacum]
MDGSLGVAFLYGLAIFGGLGALVSWRSSRRPVAVVDDLPWSIVWPTALHRWTGITIGAVVGIVIARSGELATGLLMAAPLFGLCTVVGVITGELTIRPPRGPARTATLEVRRIRDYLPRSLSRAVAVTGILLLALFAFTTAAGRPDGLGHAGRALSRQCGSDGPEFRVPWPGLFYTGRLAVAVAVGLLLAYVALCTIVRRPRPDRSTDASVDDALRERAARTVTGAVGILLAVPLAGVSLTAANSLLLFSCGPKWWDDLGFGLLMLVPVSLTFAGWCAAPVLAPLTRANPRGRAQ